MAVGRMSKFIEIISSTPTKDTEGFAVKGDTVLANVRAYMDERRGDEKWANMAAFSTATALFRFRSIPGVVIDTSLSIICDGIRYRIISAETVKGRGMYIDCLCERQEGTVR